MNLPDELPTSGKRSRRFAALYGWLNELRACVAELVPVGASARTSLGFEFAQNVINDAADEEQQMFAVYRGTYDNLLDYFEGNLCSFNGSLWECVQSFTMYDNEATESKQNGPCAPGEDSGVYWKELELETDEAGHRSVPGGQNQLVCFAFNAASLFDSKGNHRALDVSIKPICVDDQEKEFMAIASEAYDP